MKTINVGLINYLDPHRTVKCISSLLKSEYPIEEIIVYDINGDSNSSKLMADLDERIEVISNADNIGYGRAHNLMREKSKSDYYLVLNNDTVIDKYLISELISSNAVISGPRQIILDDSALEDALKLSEKGYSKLSIEEKSLFNKGYYSYFDQEEISLDSELLKNVGKSKNVKALSGACLLIDNSKFKLERLFNPNYFMYYEDLDLAKRMLSSNLGMYYNHEAIIWHSLGASSNRNRLKKEYRYLKSRYYYIFDNYTGKERSRKVFSTLLKSKDKSLKYFANIAIFPALISYIYRK